MLATRVQLQSRYVLFFDTETNGLPSNFSDPAQVTTSWPALIQIAWQLRRYSSDQAAGALVEIDQRLVRPAACVAWNQGAQQVHGITRERAEMDGEPLNVVMDAFFTAAGRADILVAHNMAFDRSVIESELYRAGDYSRRWPTAMYCTQTATTTLCQLPGYRGRFKFPKLIELHRFLFRTDGEFEWHSAQGDVACMVACFERLRWLRHIPFAAPNDSLIASRMASLRDASPLASPPQPTSKRVLGDDDDQRSKRPSLIGVGITGNGVVEPDVGVQDGGGASAGTPLRLDSRAAGVDPVPTLGELNQTPPQWLKADDAQVVTRRTEDESQGLTVATEALCRIDDVNGTPLTRRV